MGILARCESRGGYRVRVLAVHTTEGSGTAKQLRDATWWEGSSHAIADNEPESRGGGLLTPAEGCVPYSLAAWTLRSGNRWSENIELVGMASWSRATWLTKGALLDRCARWLADRHKATGVPLVKITATQYRAGASGVIGHVDHTVGYSDGTHWDPGPNFPWDVVIDKARAYAAGEEDDMPLTDADIKKIAAAVWNYNLGATKGGTNDDPISLPAESARDRVNAIRRAGVAVRDRVKQLLDGGNSAPPAV